MELKQHFDTVQGSNERGERLFRVVFEKLKSRPCLVWDQDLDPHVSRIAGSDLRRSLPVEWTGSSAI